MCGIRPYCCTWKISIPGWYWWSTNSTRHYISKKESTSISSTSGRPQWLVSHLDWIIRCVISHLQYIGLLKYKQALTKLPKIQEINLNVEDLEQTWKVPSMSSRSPPPANTIPHTGCIRTPTQNIYIQRWQGTYTYIYIYTWAQHILTGTYSYQHSVWY